MLHLLLPRAHRVLPRPLTRFALRLTDNLKNDYLGLIAAGVAFYFLLAAFPAMAALISVYGLFADPAEITKHLDLLSNFMPPESLAILSDQALKIVEAGKPALNLSLLISLLLTLYSATKGVGALIKGLNIAYNTREHRNFFKHMMTAYSLTFILVMHMIFSLILIAVLPAVMQLVSIPGSWAEILLLLRWPMLFFAALLGLQVLYNYGPCRSPHRRMRWISAGSVTATLGWVAVSAMFSLFVSNFGKYNEAYGSLGAVVVLMLWFWLSAMMILFGAEINVSLEGDGEPE